MNLKIKKLITLFVLFFAQNYVQAATNQQRPLSTTELEVAIAEVRAKKNPLENIDKPTLDQTNASAKFDTDKKTCMAAGQTALEATELFEKLEKEYLTKYPPKNTTSRP